MTIACVGTIKISVLLLYRRVFFAERVFYIYSSCLCVAVALWAVGFFFARIFMCGAQVSIFWNGFAVYKQKCKVHPISNGFGISDIITDVLVVASPIPIVWRLRLPKLQRAGVIGIFALGFLYDSYPRSEIKLLNVVRSTAAGVMRAYIVITTNRGRSPFSTDDMTLAKCRIELKKNPIHPVGTFKAPKFSNLITYFKLSSWYEGSGLVSCRNHGGSNCGLSSHPSPISQWRICERVCWKSQICYFIFSTVFSV